MWQPCWLRKSASAAGSKTSGPGLGRTRSRVSLWRQCIHRLTSREYILTRHCTKKITHEVQISGADARTFWQTVSAEFLSSARARGSLLGEWTRADLDDSFNQSLQETSALGLAVRVGENPRWWACRQALAQARRRVICRLRYPG